MYPLFALSVAIVTIIALAIAVQRLWKQNKELRHDFQQLRNGDHDRLTDLRDAVKQSRDLLMQAIRRSLVVLACLSSTAIAQAPAVGKIATIVTNGELTPDAHFHLLLIHNQDSIAAKVASILNAPRGAMQPWVSGCNVRLMAASEPQVMEHHAYLVEKHQGQMPILALVEAGAGDGRGSVWCSAAGGEIPSSEEGLASWLNTYYSANQRAATEASYLPVRSTKYRDAMESSFLPGSSGYLPSRASQSYFLPRSAPGPYRPADGRRPFFNPQLDVALPDTLNTAVGLNPETLRTLIFVGIVSIVCTLLLALSPIISATILGHAITDQPNRHPQSESE